MGTGKERKDKIEVVAEWTRPDLLALDSDLKKQKEKEGKRLRWVVTENLETKKYDGWNPVQAKEKKQHDPQSGSQLTSGIQRREMTLCEMPEELAEKRNRHFQEESSSQVRKLVDDVDEAIDRAQHALRHSGMSKKEAEEFVFGRLSIQR